MSGQQTTALEKKGATIPDALPMSPAIWPAVTTIIGGVVAAPFVYFGVESKLAAAIPINLTSAGPLVAFFGWSYLNTYLAMKVNQARIDYSVGWPNLYATGESEDAHKFNCVQRSHQHLFEMLPFVFGLTAITAPTYPILATIANVILLAGRVVTARGYQTGDVKEKNKGAFGYIAFFLLQGLAAVTTYKYLTQ